MSPGKGYAANNGDEHRRSPESGLRERAGLDPSYPPKVVKVLLPIYAYSKRLQYGIMHMVSAKHKSMINLYTQASGMSDYPCNQCEATFPTIEGLFEHAQTGKHLKKKRRPQHNKHRKRKSAQ